MSSEEVHSAITITLLQVITVISLIFAIMTLEHISESIEDK